MDAIFIWSSALVICVGLPLFFTVINVIRLFERMHLKNWTDHCLMC